MKKQIKRLSPHQNGKVFGVLMALSSLVFVIPFAFAFSFMPMGQRAGEPGMLFLIAAPIMYLVMGYVMVAVGCLIYNFAYKYIGGIEFETIEGDA
jgi:hypothetical protein